MTEVLSVGMTQKRSWDGQIIVDRQPSKNFFYTYRIGSVRLDEAIVWSHEQAQRCVVETTASRAMTIAGEGPHGETLLLSLEEREVVGLMTVLREWLA